MVILNKSYHFSLGSKLQSDILILPYFHLPLTITDSLVYNQIRLFLHGFKKKVLSPSTSFIKDMLNIAFSLYFVNILLFQNFNIYVLFLANSCTTSLKSLLFTIHILWINLNTTSDFAYFDILSLIPFIF